MIKSISNLVTSGKFNANNLVWSLLSGYTGMPMNNVNKFVNSMIKTDFKGMIKNSFKIGYDMICISCPTIGTIYTIIKFGGVIKNLITSTHTKVLGGVTFQVSERLSAHWGNIKHKCVVECSFYDIKVSVRDKKKGVAREKAEQEALNQLPEKMFQITATMYIDPDEFSSMLRIDQSRFAYFSENSHKKWMSINIDNFTDEEK